MLTTMAPYPEKYETFFRDKKNRKVFIRPVRPSDEIKVREFIYSLPKEDFIKRFFVYTKELSPDIIKSMVTIDYENQMTLVVITVEEKPGCNEKIIAMGEYIRENATSSVDVALSAHSNYQGCGIGSFLFSYLAQIAKEHGITGFMADVVSYNEPIKNILKKCGYAYTKTWRPYGGMSLISIMFDSQN